MSCAGRRLSAARRSTGSRESDPPSTAGTCSEPERICGDGMRGAMSPVVAASGDVLLIRSPAADVTGGGNVRTTRAGGGVVSVACECGFYGGRRSLYSPGLSPPTEPSGRNRALCFVFSPGADLLASAGTCVGRNLITVFATVNTLREIFFVAVRRGRAMPPDGGRGHLPARARSTCLLASALQKKCLDLCVFFRCARALGGAWRGVRTRRRA